MVTTGVLFVMVNSRRRCRDGSAAPNAVPPLRRGDSPLRGVLNSITDIPNLYPFRDLSAATLGVKVLERSAPQGLGRSLVSYLRQRDLALLTTSALIGIEDLDCVEEVERLGPRSFSSTTPARLSMNGVGPGTYVLPDARQRSSRAETVRLRDDGL